MAKPLKKKKKSVLPKAMLIPKHKARRMYADHLSPAEAAEYEAEMKEAAEEQKRMDAERKEMRDAQLELMKSVTILSKQYSTLIEIFATTMQKCMPLIESAIQEQTQKNFTE